MNIWKDYEKIFPESYINFGFFDGLIAGYLMEPEFFNKKVKILSVGGGNSDSNFKSIDVWLVDPYVDKPKGVIDILSWDSIRKLDNLKFDFIILRGSLNYLSEDKLKLLKSRLVYGGRILANTFGEPKEITEREYKTVYGCPGKEKAEYNKETKKITHTLNINGEWYRHEFT